MQDLQLSTSVNFLFLGFANKGSNLQGSLHLEFVGSQACSMGSFFWFVLVIYMELLLPNYKWITKLSNSTFAANKDAFRVPFRAPNSGKLQWGPLYLSETSHVVNQFEGASLVSLGIWGPLPDKIHRLDSLELLDLSSNFIDKLFHFLEGLKPWARLELQRQKVQDLKVMIAAAECLNGYNDHPGKRKMSFTSGANTQQVSGNKLARREKTSSWGANRRFPGRDPTQNRVAECPQRSAYNAMVATTKDGERVNAPMGDTEPEPARMGSIRFITTLQSQLSNLRKEPERGLMYVDISVNGKTSKALFDTGATYTFISPEEAKKCKLIVTKEVGQMKAVNSATSTICGGVKRVSIKLGSWEGSVDFTVSHMDDFDVVLGLNFMMAAQGEPSFLVFPISKEDDNLGTVPKNVQEVLRDFEDVMPGELPKELPPRWLVDHEIELIPGVKPPAKCPYRMSPPELAKLRKQLDELLQAGFIRPSKSPFGAPVFRAGSEGANVVSAEVIFHDNPRKSSGYAFVSFKSKKEADAALSTFQGKMFMGRQIRVQRSRQFVKFMLARSGINQHINISPEMANEIKQAENQIKRILGIGNRISERRLIDDLTRMGMNKSIVSKKSHSSYAPEGPTINRPSERAETRTRNKVHCPNSYVSYIPHRWFLGNKGALNKVTVRNKYPIPLIADLFDQLSNAKYFTKLDLWSGYHQVRVAEGDEPKMACVFHDYLDKFVVIYLDDIMIFSTSIEEHLEHLRLVLTRLWENQLFVKKEKCTFAQTQVHLLGHIIERGRIRMDKENMKAIQEWPTPQNVSEFRSYLGLANYYRRFVEGYSRRVKLLTDLLKKGCEWVWFKDCQEAFDDLKKVVISEPVLTLPDLEKPLEVETDASDYVIGGVLLQNKHPVAFESMKLNETEARYTAPEKELLAVIHCFRIWRHYLLGSKFVVKTDNTAVSHFLTQAKLTAKQARWQEFLAEFDFNFEHKAGKKNQVADALSRMTDLAALRCVAPISASRVSNEIRQLIVNFSKQDPQVVALMEMVKKGGSKWFWIENGLLMTKGSRMFVLRVGNLRQKLLKECHDTPWAGYPDKVDRQRTVGLLEPLPVLARHWESISLDFISRLPRVGDLGSILVGIPQSIVSDRDGRFIGKFLKGLFQLMGTQLNFSSSYHPQTDGQTERFNGLLEEYLRHFIQANQKNWPPLLDVTQLCFNSQKSSSTNKSPFELVTSQQPRLPHTVDETSQGRCPRASNFVGEWKQNMESQGFLGESSEAYEEMRKSDHLLVRKYEGLVSIVAKVGNASYNVDPPTWIGVYPVFHVSNLKSFHTDPNVANQSMPPRELIGTQPPSQRHVDEILAGRIVKGWTTDRVWVDPHVKIYEIKTDLVGKRPFRMPHGLATELTTLSCPRGKGPGIRVTAKLVYHYSKILQLSTSVKFLFLGFANKGSTFRALLHLEFVGSQACSMGYFFWIIVTELKIRGDKLANIGGFNGYATPGKTLSLTFSIDSLVTTLTRLTSLRVLSLVSLGIWGPLPDKIHRLDSLELLDLSSNFMFGSIPPQISRMVTLQTLTLDGNYFNDTIPETLDSLSNLTVLSFRGNRLKGHFPSSICQISNLTDIALCHNKLSGKLPVMPQGLVTALLAQNLFSGDIPAQFGRLSHLQHLDLSSNHLSGTPPSALFDLPSISYLNLASNLLSGSFPEHLTCSSKLGFIDISSNKLAGDLPSCLDSKSDKRAVKYGGNCLSTDGQQQHQGSYCKEANTRRSGRKLALLIAVIVVSVLLLMLLAFGTIILFQRCRPRRTFETHIWQKAVQDNPTTGVSSDVLANARFISELVKLGTQGSPVFRLFSMEELEEATNNFDSSMFMGEGYTGKLYRGRLENGTYVAIRSLTLLKKHSIQNLKVKLVFLSKIHHPHLVGLLGHWVDGGALDDSGVNKVFLVYDYVPNRNYRMHLSETCPEKVLKWSERLAILIDVAKAVHFLHTGVIPGVYNNRLKTNNILLDEYRIAKLSDYGMSIIMEENEKLKACEGCRLKVEASFGSQDGRKRIVDPTVLTTCSQESLSIVVSVTGKCICLEPSSRPSFADVLWNLQYAAQVQASADADQKSDSTS
ncbi:putative amine oxidase [Hibiscus syriacus]|uniref:RNA-directed DNA polymerase n=1 Tax=Hibiscus syriacus TaxID=106335 RepID=A0A6A2ZBL9_HIBSY|nr:putative amine oxidase [Hibiscus syriacus]